MNNGESSSSGQPAFDDEFEKDLENWLNSSWVTSAEDSGTNLGTSGDDMTINPNYPSQPLMPVVNVGTNFGGGSSNMPQCGIRKDMKSSSTLITNNRSNISQGSGQILSSAIQSLSKNKAVQQPQAQYLANQSTIPIGDQMNQLHYQMPSNRLLPCTRPMANTQTMNLRNNQTQRVQQPQQVVGMTSSNLMSRGGLQQGSDALPDLSASVGFAAPGEFSSSAAYREYVFKVIQTLKERHYNTLAMMHSNILHFLSMGTVDAASKYEYHKVVLERMMIFLNIPTVDAIPKDDNGVHNYINMMVNYVNHHTRVSPVQLINPSQRVTNLEANMVNLNQNFTSRTPQPQETRMPTSLNNKSFQTNLNQKPENALRIGSLNAPQPTVSNIKQHMTSGPKTSSVIGSASPISLPSNTIPTSLPSRPLNHQLPVTNQKFSSEKMKQPIPKTDEFTKPKTLLLGMSSLGSSLVSQCPSHQFCLPSSMNPITQKTSVSPSKYAVNKVLSPDSVARPPFLLSSSSSTPSGISSVTTVENQKHATPTGPPCQEPQNSKDAIHHLTEVVKSMSSKALSSSVTDISSMEKAMDVIPDCIPANLVGKSIDNEVKVVSEYDKESHLKMRREFTVTSTRYDQLDCQEWDIYSAETLFNKKPKTGKWVLMEEIKEINAKLLETTIHVVLNPSEDNINVLLGGQEGTIIKCLFRNVCFPDLLGPQGCLLSEKMPEFGILLLVPFEYPDSSIGIFRWGQNLLNEPWGKLYEDMLARFDLTLHGSGMLFLGDLAINWDASARAVMLEYMQKLSAKGFSSRYGSWECCINSSSSLN